VCTGEVNQKKDYMIRGDFQRRKKKKTALLCDPTELARKSQAGRRIKVGQRWLFCGTGKEDKRQASKAAATTASAVSIKGQPAKALKNDEKGEEKSESSGVGDGIEKKDHLNDLAHRSSTGADQPWAKHG